MGRAIEPQCQNRRYSREDKHLEMRHEANFEDILR